MCVCVLLLIPRYVNGQKIRHSELFDTVRLSCIVIANVACNDGHYYSLKINWDIDAIVSL